MTLILSTLDDKSTVDVIRWLLYLGVTRDEIVRLNDTDLPQIQQNIAKWNYEEGYTPYL